MYEIRIFKDFEKYDDEKYYSGTDDMVVQVHTQTSSQLIKEWEHLLKNYEGYTYSVWDNNNLIIASVFDPNDIDYINDYLKEKNNEQSYDEYYRKRKGQLNNLDFATILHSIWDNNMSSQDKTNVIVTVKRFAKELGTTEQIDTFLGVFEILTGEELPAIESEV